GSVELMQADLSDLGLAGLDVGAQKQDRLVSPAPQHSAQDLSVLLVSCGDAVGLSEVQAAKDADALGDVAMATHDFRVACCGNQRGMKVLVQPRHLVAVAESVVGRH